jgi:hypothetical protein
MSGYHHPGDGTVESPRQIVTRLQDLIAAKSPAHAELVRRFRERQALEDARFARLEKLRPR